VAKGGSRRPRFVSSASTEATSAFDFPPPFPSSFSRSLPLSFLRSDRSLGHSYPSYPLTHGSHPPAPAGRSDGSCYLPRMEEGEGIHSKVCLRAELDFCFEGIGGIGGTISLSQAKLTLVRFLIAASGCTWSSWERAHRYRSFSFLSFLP